MYLFFECFYFLLIFKFDQFINKLHKMANAKMNNFCSLKQNSPINDSDMPNQIINQTFSITNSSSSSSACSSFASSKNNKNNIINKPVHRLQKSDETTTLIGRLPVNIPSALLSEEELEGGELLSVEEVCN